MPIGVPNNPHENIVQGIAEEKKDELIITLNENGIPDGNIAKFSKVHQEGYWHRVALVCIVNKRNQVLLQQRSSLVNKYPDLWDISVASHVYNKDATSIEAAKRSIIHELGIPLDFEIKLREPLKTIDFQ